MATEFLLRSSKTTVCGILLFLKIGGAFLGMLLQKDDNNGHGDSNSSDSNGISRNIDRS